MNNFLWLLLANGAWLFAIFDSLKRFERYMIKYAQFSYFDKTKSKFDKIILDLFCERKGKYSKFVFYSFKYETFLAIMQIPILIWAYFSKVCLNNIFVGIYLILLLVLGFWPEVVTNIFRMVYYFRSKKIEGKVPRSKNNNVNIYTLKYKKILQKQSIIFNAVDKYIIVKNAKKNTRYITPESIEKVNDLIKKEFPYAYTKEYIDEKGIKIFEVYFEYKKEKISVITIPILSQNDRMCFKM